MILFLTPLSIKKLRDSFRKIELIFSSPQGTVYEYTVTHRAGLIMYTSGYVQIALRHFHHYPQIRAHRYGKMCAAAGLVSEAVHHEDQPMMAQLLLCLYYSVS